MLKSERNKPRRTQTIKESASLHTSPLALPLEQVLPTIRLPKERIATTFLRLLLVALALLQCLPGSSLTHYLTTDAVFGPAVEPQSVRQGTAAPARPSVFTETCRGGSFGSASRAALVTVVELAWLRHGWRGAGVVLGVVYDLM